LWAFRYFKIFGASNLKENMPDQTTPCPCGSSLSEEDAIAINWGRLNAVFQNPVGSQIGSADNAFAANSARIIQIAGVFGAETGELSRLSNSITTATTALNNYRNHSNRMSGLSYLGLEPDLMSVVSTVQAAVNFQCALGIPGLDVTGSIGLMTENGKLQLNRAIGVNLNLSKLLNNIDLGGSTGDIGRHLSNMTSEINGVVETINDIAGQINGGIAKMVNLMTDATNFIAQYSQINFAKDFAADPCTTFGVGFQGGIVNNTFSTLSQNAAAPVVKTNMEGFGITTR
jgi:hypothetical protein